VLRRLLIVIGVLLIVIVIAADRIGAAVGAHVLAGKVQHFEDLPQRPSASIEGIPFLTQAFGGKYNNVKITAHRVPVNDVTVTTLTANLHGVHLPFTKAVHGSVSQVPVDRANGTAFVSFADANAYLASHPVGGQHVQISAGGSANSVKVTDRARVAGATVSLHGVGLVSVSGNVVRVDVSQFSGSAGPGTPKQPGRARHVSVSLPLQGLPFRLQLISVNVSASGLTGTGSANDIVLGSPVH
jgi:LmeA-like phospholipid-binding